MRIVNQQLPAKKQLGFTIVELLIAGVLGILLLAGVVQLFVGSNQNYSLQEQLADIQEDGRFALIFLKEELQKGGWVDDGQIAAGIPIAVNIANSSDGVTDSIAVTYNVLDGGPDAFDCNGAAVTGGGIENRFYVGGTNGDELLCQGNGGGAAQPLINGVSNFQVLYGIETDVTCPDGIVNVYLTRDEYNAADAAAIAVDPKKPIALVSVRVALLLSSGENVLPANEVNPYQLLDTAVTTNDRLAHRLFQQTIYMPNAILPIMSNSNLIMGCASQI